MNTSEKFLHLRKRIIHSNNKVSRKINSKVYGRFIKKHHSYIPKGAQIGEGIVFPHLFGIFISRNAVIGENCVIFQMVTIGANTLDGSKKEGSPIIGNNCYIGAGATIIGNITIGNNCRIGANCCVTTDIPDYTTVVSERPRQMINNK